MILGGRQLPESWAFATTISFTCAALVCRSPRRAGARKCSTSSRGAVFQWASCCAVSIALMRDGENYVASVASHHAVLRHSALHLAFLEPPLGSAACSRTSRATSLGRHASSSGCCAWRSSRRRDRSRRFSNRRSLRSRPPGCARGMVKARGQGASASPAGTPPLRHHGLRSCFNTGGALSPGVLHMRLLARFWRVLRRQSARTRCVTTLPQRVHETGARLRTTLRTSAVALFYHSMPPRDRRG